MPIDSKYNKVEYKLSEMQNYWLMSSGEQYKDHLPELDNLYDL